MPLDRPDAPGVLHRMIIRGIERRNIKGDEVGDGARTPRPFSGLHPMKRHGRSEIRTGKGKVGGDAPSLPLSHETQEPTELIDELLRHLQAEYILER